MNEAAGLTEDVPNSPYFAHTLRRAIALAERNSHRLATPEHLLMALLDDPDAKAMLDGVQADTVSLRMKLTEVISRQMNALHAPGVELQPSLEFDRVLRAAGDLASRSPRGERDGAFVLAALSWEPEGPAANSLRQCGLTSDAAVGWLNAFRSAARHPAPRKSPKPEIPQRPEPPQWAEHAPRPENGPRPARPGAGRRPPEAARAEPARPQAGRAEAARPAPPQTRHDTAEETLEEMLARVRSILDDEPAAPEPSPAASTKRPAPSAAPEPVSARVVQIRQPEPAAPAARPRSRGGAVAPEKPQAPLPFGGVPRAQNAAPQPPTAPRAPAAPQAAAPAPTQPTRGAAPREAAARDTAPRDAAPPPLAPGRSLAPIPQPKPRSEIGKLVENIPRSMRESVAERVEVRLSREETGALLAGFEGRGEIKSHTVFLTRAMSVMLRAPEGGFIIENLSPETQWIVDRPSFLETEPFGRWRWMVTPTESGNHKLLLIISARNVDDNGMIGDTPLPDQVIDVSVQTNFRRNAGILARWAAAMVAGGVITEAASWTFRLLFR